MASQSPVMDVRRTHRAAAKIVREPARSVWTTRAALVGASLATSVLLWLAYFPVSCGWLAWFALVPLLVLVRARERSWFLYLCACLSGLAFFEPVLWWMHAADGLRDTPLSLGPMTAGACALGVYCALYFPLAILLLRRLERRSRLPLVLTLPVVWTGLEFVRSVFGTGFPWYFLGHSQHDFLPIIQIADLGGAYLVTFLVAAVNAALFECLFAWPALRTLFHLRGPASGDRWRRRLLLTGGVAALVLAALIYGDWRLGQDAFRVGPRLALLQSDLDQRLRNQAGAPTPDLTAVKKVAESYKYLLGEAARQRPDLIVWPETSFDADWIETAPAAREQISKEYYNRPAAALWYRLDQQTREFVRGRARAAGTNMLLGLLTRELVDLDQKPLRYNSALLVKPGGATGGRYDKIHRLPFGEYVPLRDWLPFMDTFSPYDYDYSVLPGKHLTRLPLEVRRGKQAATLHFGVLICYEDSDPTLARQYGRKTSDGPAADFLINISNDGWFNGSAEHEQHLAICRFRAIEARRSIARSVNMGISAIIDSNGRVLRPKKLFSYDPDHPDFHLWDVAAETGALTELPVSEWHDFKHVSGVLLGTIPLDERTSLYALWGDWLPWGCWLGIGSVLTAAWLRRRGRGFTTKDTKKTQRREIMVKRA
jgi:apolipoprotein N-acyltransferase